MEINHCKVFALSISASIQHGSYMDNANFILIGMATVSSAPGDDSAVAVETEQGTVGNVVMIIIGKNYLHQKPSLSLNVVLQVGLLECLVLRLTTVLSLRELLRCSSPLSITNIKSLQEALKMYDFLLFSPNCKLS